MANSPITPTVGRVVLYMPPHPLDAARPLGEDRPALVVRVRDNWHVDLNVQAAGIDRRRVPSKMYGDFVFDALPVNVPYDDGGAVGTWRWMPYQMSKAAEQPGRTI